MKRFLVVLMLGAVALAQRTNPIDVNRIRYVNPSGPFNWSQTDSAGSIGNLSVVGTNTLTLAPCPLGINGTDTNLFIYISGVGTPEAARSTGAGNCTPNAASGTVVVTTLNTHGAGFTVGTSTGGFYEAYKDASATNANNVHIVAGPTNPPGSLYYSFYAPMITSGAHIEIDGGSSATIDCNAKTACFQTTGNNSIVRIHGFRVASHTSYPGAAITNTACAANVSTITSTLNPDVGTVVDIQQTFNKHYWGIHTVATTSAGSWTYTDTNCGGVGSIASAASAGGNAYLNAFAYIATTSAAGSEVYDIAVDQPGGFTATVNNLVVIANDQGFHVHDIATNSALSNCNINYCGQMIYAPGPFSTNAAVLQADHLQLSLFCNGNGITAYNGNTVSVSDSVIQGFAEWAIAGGTATGGFGGFTLSNVYNEVGACSNPNYSGTGLQVRAEAGILLQGSGATVRGGEFPIGQIPKFAATGNGNRQYNYWAVIKDSVLGTSAPLICGYATVDSVTPTGSITVQCPRVNGTNTITYDILRTSGAGNAAVAPYNGGCPGGTVDACGSVLTAQAQCSTTICSYTDTASASTTSYAVATHTYFPFLNFWPGGAVLSAVGDTTNIINGGSGLQADTLGFVTNLSPIVSTVTTVPSVSSTTCNGSNAGIYVSCLAGNSSGNTIPSVTGTLLQIGGATGGSSTTGQKGRLNFINPPGSSVWQQHIITLVDSAANKTLATTFYRPSADSTDSYIGLDNGSVSTNAAQVAIGSPVAISRYIANVGDGTNWKERLTGNVDTFHVPINAFPTDNTKIPITSQCGTGAATSQSCFSVLDQGGGSVIVGNNDGSVLIGGGTTKSISSATAANSDLVGELVFSGGTSSTSYTFTGTYTSHPECSIGPQFDYGAHRIWWSTISTTTIQLSSDAAQTGNVSYICVGRN